MDRALPLTPLRSTSTSKAIAATLGRLAVLYGYPFFILNLFVSDFYELRESYTTFVGLPPRLVVAPLYSYAEMRQPWSAWFSDLMGRWPGLLAMAIYVAIAAFLTYRTLTRFDRWLDRPELTQDDQSEPKAAEVREQAEPALQS